VTFTDWAQNPVCTVRWAGWSSDTLTLQRAGWQFAAQQEKHRGTVRLALRHPQGWHGLTNEVNYERVRHMLAGRDGSVFAHDGRLLTFDVVCLGSNVQVCASSVPMTGWRAVDMFPASTTAVYEQRSLLDWVPFMPVNHEAEQIVVAPESVGQVLDLLLRCQAPAAAARRARDRVRHSRDLKAQVLVA
jgi:hypothetical protein